VKQSHKFGVRFVLGEDRADTRLDAAVMSDGALRALGIMTAVLQQPRPSLLAIEEPEASMDPESLGGIQGVLYHASRTGQLVVTTHSPELLEAKWLEDHHFRVVSREGGRVASCRCHGLPARRCRSG